MKYEHADAWKTLLTKTELHSQESRQNCNLTIAVLLNVLYLLHVLQTC